MAQLQSNTRIYGTGSFDGQLIVANVSPVISTSNTTGSLVVTGGVGITGNVYTGNLTITGPSTGITFVDGTRQLVAYNPGADVFQNTQITSITSTLTTLNTNLTAVNNYAAGAFNKANTSLANTGTLVTVNSASQLFVSNNTTSTSNNTGALIIRGGLGVSSNINADLVISAYAPRSLIQISNASITPTNTYDQYAFTALATGLTINAPTGSYTDGQKIMFRILDSGSSQTLSWNATYTVIGATLPITTTSGKTSYVGCIYNLNNTRWDVVAVATQA